MSRQKTQLSKELLDRLVCAKYLYWRGISTLEESNTFSSGMAVLNFHDSVEMALRVIAEHIEAPIKPHEYFNSLIDKIEKEGRKLGLPSLSKRSALNELNTARRSFKHHALEPKYKDANKFKSDLEYFYNDTFKAYLSLDFQTLSLADLIKHHRTANWLHKAEKHLNNSAPYEASACVAVAFEIFRRYKDRPSLWSPFNSIGREMRSFGRDNQTSRAVNKLAEEIDDKLDEMRGYIDILFDGIDPLKFKKFINLTPSVGISMANTIVQPYFDEKGQLTEHERNLLKGVTNETAVFCYEFAVDTILKLQDQNFPPEYPYRFQEILFLTTKETPVYVYTDAEEIITYVGEGKLLKSHPHHWNPKLESFIPIVFDNEVAYVPKENIQRSSPVSLNDELSNT